MTESAPPSTGITSRRPNSSEEEEEEEEQLARRGTPTATAIAAADRFQARPVVTIKHARRRPLVAWVAFVDRHVAGSRQDERPY